MDNPFALYCCKPTRYRTEIRRQGAVPGQPPELRIEGPDNEGILTFLMQGTRVRFPVHVISQMQAHLAEMAKEEPGKQPDGLPLTDPKNAVTLTSNADEETFTLTVKHGETTLDMKGLDWLRNVADSMYYVTLFKQQLFHPGEVTDVSDEN